MGTLDYYAAIARLAPGALALSAMRRVQGVARQARYRRRERADEAVLLEAYGVARAEDLAVRALDQRASRVWCEVSQRDSALEALFAIPGARERAQARAHAALRQEWDVFGTPVSFGEGRPVDWSLDVVSGHRYPLAPVERMAAHASGNDPKYPWVLGRLDSVLALAQGAWVAGPGDERSRLTSALVMQVLDFLQANPVGQGVHWTCPMEVALRAANLAQALVMCADAPLARRPEFLVPVLGALVDHSAWVAAHLEDRGAVPNNHLVSDYVGLLVVGLLFPELPGASRHVALAVRGLCEQMAAQVHVEGTSFEGSIPYHRLAVELFTLAYVVAKGAGVPLGFAYENRLRRMFHATRAWCSETGLAPQIGDNDSGRVFPWRERGDTEQGYLVGLGAALFADPGLGGGELPDEAAWLLGRQGLERWRRLPPAVAPLSVSFPDGGFHVLRGGGAVVTVSAGRQGQRGVGGHSHNDKLSFELHLGGRPVIVDPGTGSYTRDPALRNALRSTAAHNTVQVDGVEQAPLDPARLFALPEDAKARMVAFLPSQDVDRLRVRHDGYRLLPAPVGLERAFRLDRRERALTGADRFIGTGRHEVVGRFHLPDAQARRLAPDAQVLARARRAVEGPVEFEPLAVELGPAGAPLAWLLLEAGLGGELVPSRYSPGYGRVVPAVAVEFRRRVTPPLVLKWVVVFR
ncbi:heparinase II/III family protein [Myxococcus stipitatus]|uniref:heparinase II/III family protein n=1 Tax=Myxococcus stipitatus TaxID=83455 RepID=UPI001F346A26|nr:alginate lyase family protein [Myxococcus stipitatus]MCE9666893.1 heparinase II/III family protein [Myxococcus stipitatus]